ncbi:MAG: glycosyltransferase [Synechococcaceae cyanobacterium]
MRILVVSTPMGPLGSGRGGGVELTAAALTGGLLERGHAVTLLAPAGSVLPAGCGAARLWCVAGSPPPGAQHQPRDAPLTMPAHGVLPALWRRALAEQADFDVLLNLAYDWLPLWLTPHLATPLAHLVSMGSVSEAIDAVIAEVVRIDGGRLAGRLAFHTASQAADFDLPGPPVLVGNGFDLSRYDFQPRPMGLAAVPATGPLLGWAGRIAPEKGLEDAAAVAAARGWPLAVWGLREDPAYAAWVEASVPAGTVHWRGFLATADLQAELGGCSVLLNTPRWNEAYGNVVVEAMACGVPVAAYARGGPAELVQEGVNGALAPPDDRAGLAAAVDRALAVDRAGCRAWVERHASQQAFAARLEAWLAAVVAAA